MGERLIDRTGAIDFVDRSSETCFTDRDGNFTCGDGGGSQQILMGQICMSLLLALLPLV